jgi:hypothetical protein
VLRDAQVIPPRVTRRLRQPKRLAQLARTSLRRKISALAEAFPGHFTAHHAFSLAKMLAQVDAIDADIADLGERIEELIIPFAAADRLDEIPASAASEPRPSSPRSAPI